MKADDWLLKLNTEKVLDFRNEEVESSRYWSTQEEQGFTYQNYSQFHVALIGRIISHMGYKKVVEIGCGSGRNLKSLNSLPELGFEKLIGYDFNDKFIDFGVKNFGLELYCGNLLNDEELPSVKEKSACFSISVLDHIARPEDLAAGLAKRFETIVLLEPALDKFEFSQSVKLKSISLNDKETESQPFTYIHDYRNIFVGNGFSELVNVPIWPSVWGSGSAYRLMVYTSQLQVEPDKFQSIVWSIINQAVNDERVAWRKLINISKRKLGESESKGKELTSCLAEKVFENKSQKDEMALLSQRIEEAERVVNNLIKLNSDLTKENRVLYRLVKRLY